MAEPLPVETADNVFERTAAEIAALRSYQPKTRAEERRRSTELVRLKRTQLDLAQRVIEENAARKIAEVAGNDHANAAPRLNGSNGHAPATDQTNWAQVIGEMAAQQELSCRRQIEAVKEYLTDLVAKSGGLRESDITALAQGLVPFQRECIADAIRPLSVRLDEIEAVVRTMVKARARNDG
jgi:hypothetical protein